MGTSSHWVFFCAKFDLKWNGCQDHDRRLPRLLARAASMLVGLEALFLDWLLDRTTDFGSGCHSLEGFDLSLKLWNHWLARFPKLVPGDEYAISIDFAQMAGLAGLYSSVKEPDRPD